MGAYKSDSKTPIKKGNVAYVNLDLTVSTVYPADRKVPAKRTAEKVAKEPEHFTIA